ncbi:Integrase catalytic region [Klebsiella michiganensis HKOPL1]|nr:Integrase catalytic region [Klebsiella michiganensis HKOPL1]
MPNLHFRCKIKQRLLVRNPALLVIPAEMNQSWSVCFMHDALVCVRRCRTFNLLTDFNREALSRVVDLYIMTLSVV